MNNDIYDKLALFLRRIEDETLRPIKIVESENLGLKGMLAAFRYDKDQIIIIIKKGVSRSDPDLTRSIAHEATHGYLIFKLGYCRPVFNENVSENLVKKVHLIFTMIDDIVVNKIIQNNGFLPFGSEYLVSMEFETKSALGGKNVYENFSNDPIFNEILMISRYIIAWAFLEYYDIEKEEIGAINSFLSAFETNFHSEIDKISKIKNIIQNNNIFDSSGHCKAIKEILELLGIQNGLKLQKEI